MIGLGPQKPSVTPQMPMRPLFWKKIQLTEIRNPYSGADMSSVDCLWEGLEEPEIDVSEFEDLFAKAPLKKKMSPEKLAKAKKTKEVAKLLDAKRSQAIGIFISSLHLQAAEIETAILEFDMSNLSLEALNTLYELRPENAELETIQKHLRSKPDIALDRPEQFVYDLSLIPCFADRCYCLIFQSTFTETLSSIEHRLTNIRMIVQNLTTSKSVENLLGLILALGNYMNGGTTRGQADGFSLEILAKLKDVKSKDNSVSLLQYVVAQYVRKYDPDAGTDRTQLPIPEPSDINQASLVNFEDLEQELKKAQTSLEKCQQHIARVVRESTLETTEPFKTNMTKFVNKAEVDLNEQKNSLLDAQKRFHQCTSYFAVKPKPGEGPFLNPKDFFGLWSVFCQEFKDLWKREQQRIMKEKVDVAQRRVKQLQEEKKTALTTTPKTKSGLKAKLASRGMI